MSDEDSVRNSFGHLVHFDPNDARGRALRARGGEVNPASGRLWRFALALAPWDTVIDVGANYGEMLASADLTRARRVVAFEPNPAVLPSLRRTVSGLPVPVELVEAAVGEIASEEVALVADAAWSGRSHVQPLGSSGAGGSRHVRSLSLDAFFDGDLPSTLCLKIDVEGLELQVLKGAERLLTHTQRAAVVLEILHTPVQDVARLTGRWPIYLMRADGSRIDRWDGTDAAELGRMLHSGDYHRENALLLAGRDVRAFDSEVRASSGRTTRRAVYTALFGGYERLQEQPVARQSDVPFICLTDDPELRSETWRVRLVTVEYPLDTVRSARTVKLVGHPELASYDQTLWIDNRVVLRRTPESLLDEWLRTADFAVPLHSFREQVVDEFAAVAAGGHDDASRVYEQLIHYAELTPDVLEEQPYWTGIVARRWNGEVGELMRRWLDHVLRYSRRDQLSLNAVLAQASVRLGAQAIDNLGSDWHEWLPIDAALGRRAGIRTVRFDQSVRAPLSRLREAERQGLERAEQLAGKLRDATARAGELEAEAVELRAAVEEVERARAVADETLSDAAAQIVQDAARIDELVTERDHLVRELGGLAAENSALRQRLRTARARIRDLKAKLVSTRSELRTVKGSRSYRVAAKFGRAVGRGGPTAGDQTPGREGGASR